MNRHIVPKLVIVSPCYNEEAILAYSAERLTSLLQQLVQQAKIAPESYILYVNDGSRDRTWELIEELHQRYAEVSGLCLAGNVGHQSAIMAGMLEVVEEADAVITIDADLQDDLGAIETMIDRYREGYDIVYGVKKTREADPWLKRTTALTFYRLQSAMGIRAVYNHADFRLLSQAALRALASYPERNLYLRGLIAQLGFPSAEVDDHISARVAGSSKYTVRKMLILAIDGITSFTTRPISWIIAMGFLSLLISVAMAVYVLVSYVEHRSVPGWASLMLSLWFIGSMLLFSLGVVGQYIGKIYMEVKARPRYHIAKQLKHHDRSTEPAGPALPPPPTYPPRAVDAACARGRADKDVARAAQQLPHLPRRLRPPHAAALALCRVPAGVF